MGTLSCTLECINTSLHRQPQPLSFLACRRHLLHALNLCNILSHNLPTDEIDARAGEVLSAIDDPLKERDCNDDGERDDAVVYEGELAHMNIGG